jgi:hypothetical protein
MMKGTAKRLKRQIPPGARTRSFRASLHHPGAPGVGRGSGDESGQRTLPIACVTSSPPHLFTRSSSINCPLCPKFFRGGQLSHDFRSTYVVSLDKNV